MLGSPAETGDKPGAKPEDPTTIPPGELICNINQHQAQLRQGTWATSAIKTQRRTQARARHREEDSQAGLPKAVPLSPKMGSQLEPGSQGLVLPRAGGSTHKVLGGHKDRDQYTPPQPTTEHGCSRDQL